MFSCQICGAMNLPSLGMLLSHIRLTHAFEPGFIVQCHLQGCKRTFRNFSTFRNHLYNFHKGVESVVDDATAPINMDSDTNESGNEDNEDNMPNESNAVSEHILQRAAALWILKTKETHRIPQSVMDDMLLDLGSLFQCALASISSEVQCTLKQHEVSDDTIKSALDHLEEESPFGDIFRGLKTHHLQLKEKFDLVVSQISGLEVGDAKLILLKRNQ